MRERLKLALAELQASAYVWEIDLRKLVQQPILFGFSLTIFATAVGWCWRRCIEVHSYR